MPVLFPKQVANVINAIQPKKILRLYCISFNSYFLAKQLPISTDNCLLLTEIYSTTNRFVAVCSPSCTLIKYTPAANLLTFKLVCKLWLCEVSL